jgi:hypothetical protein
MKHEDKEKVYCPDGLDSNVMASDDHHRKKLYLMIK